MKPVAQLALLALLSTSAFAYKPKPAPVLHSPWDATPVTLTQTPFDCGHSIPIARDIIITTKLDAPGPTSTNARRAAYLESSNALFDLSREVVSAADNYRSTGSSAAASCVATLLSTAAAGHGMAGRITSHQAWKDQGRALRAYAIAWLKVRDSGVIPADQSALILAWFNDIVEQEHRRFQDANCDTNGCYRLDHEGLEAAMAAAAIAIASNDHRLFERSIGQYRNAVHHIDERGMLYYDTDRQYALKFHLESAAALVQIAELAQANGVDLYDYDGGAIHLLIHTVTRGLIDSSPFRTATGIDQAMPSALQTWEVSWASVYDQRFPDPVIDRLLQQVNFKGSDTWGGEPFNLDDHSLESAE